MKKQFKVGDTVRLKKNLKVGKYYNGLMLLDGMVFEGTQTICTVEMFVPIVVLNNDYGYSFDMLMLVKEKS